jgi:hypothetical protein
MNQAISAFNRTKAALADAALLIHEPMPHSPTCLITDASNDTGAMLRSVIPGSRSLSSPIPYEASKDPV